MGNIYDIFVLNSLWLLCCLPVFTIGPSTTALFYSMINLVRGEEHSVSRDFFHSFRQNFKQGILLGLPLGILFLFWGCVALYSFPLLAKFDKKNKDILIWAFTLSIKHFGRTAAMLFALAAGLWICHILPGLIFIAFGLIAEFQASVLSSILRPYLPDVYEQTAERPLFSDEENEIGGES